MDQTALLQQIEKLIDKKLLPIQKQLVGLDANSSSIAAKLALLDAKIEVINKKVEFVDKKIDKMQEETIEALSDLIHTAYNMHEERITKIEEQLKTSQAH